MADFVREETQNSLPCGCKYKQNIGLWFTGTAIATRQATTMLEKAIFQGEILC
jgi:hypothetical protein